MSAGQHSEPATGSAIGNCAADRGSKSSAVFTQLCPTVRARNNTARVRNNSVTTSSPSVLLGSTSSVRSKCAEPVRNEQQYGTIARRGVSMQWADAGTACQREICMADDAAQFTALRPYGDDEDCAWFSPWTVESSHPGRITEPRHQFVTGDVFVAARERP